MNLDVYKIDGSKTGEQVTLDEGVFGIEPNDHVIYLNVKSHLANKRQGTSKAKERNEVKGGGRKPFKQKGRGGARAGTTRSPLWVGGGTIFGPKPRTYSNSLSKKVSKLGRKSAYSYKAKAEQIMVVENFNYESPKTKEFSKLLKALNLEGKKTLMLTSENLVNVFKSGRNIQKVNILEATNASTYDILNNQILLVQKDAIEKIVNILN